MASSTRTNCMAGIADLLEGVGGAGRLLEHNRG